MRQGLLIGSMTLLLTAGGAVHGEPSDAIYVSTGEHGEISFSDVAEPGAERVQVETSEPAPDALALLQRRIELTLTVANALEQSRLAREDARAEARADARDVVVAAQQPQVVYQDRSVYYPYVWRDPYRYGFDHQGRFRHHDRFHKHPHGDRDKQEQEPRQRTISRKFIYDPD